MSRRFKFGRNWNKYLNVLNEDRIISAEISLKEYLNVKSLNGKTFLDIGAGSGLFSLAARRLGAHVQSFDYDKESVACNKKLKDKYFLNDSHWIIERGSILSNTYLNNLDKYDIVYSWGVLHHTGDMYLAINNSTKLLNNNGILFISIYNDQKYFSNIWKFIKKTYVSSPTLIKWTIILLYALLFIIVQFTKDILIIRNPFKRYQDYKSNRGMSMYYDWIDWVGGYPFETAKPEEIIDYCIKRGFNLKKLKTNGGGSGCNEFVFVKTSE